VEQSEVERANEAAEEAEVDAAGNHESQGNPMSKSCM